MTPRASLLSLAFHGHLTVGLIKIYLKSEATDWKYLKDNCIFCDKTCFESARKVATAGKRSLIEEVEITYHSVYTSRLK